MEIMGLILLILGIFISVSMYGGWHGIIYVLVGFVIGCLIGLTLDWMESGKNEKALLDPVRQGDDDKWYFYDEVWSDRFGPYNTEEEARKKLEEYQRYLG